MRILDLITDPQLRLELATPSHHIELESPIISAVATESIDPAAYLSPGTLILTTGMALNFDDPRIWDAYIERLVSAGVPALAFGVGKPHISVPHGLLAAARDHKLPILIVPGDVPFLQLQNLVVRALAEEEFQASHQAWSIAEECTDLATQGASFGKLLDHVAERTSVALRVVDDAQAVFALGGHDVTDDAWALGQGTFSLPLSVGDGDRWELECLPNDRTLQGQNRGGSGRRANTHISRLRTVLSPAAAVLGMTLSHNLSSGLWASGDSAGLLTALQRTDEQADGAIKQALHDHGIDSTVGLRLISIRASSPIRLHMLAWRLTELVETTATAIPMDLTNSVLVLIAPRTGLRSETVRPETGDGASQEPYLDQIPQTVNAEAGDSMYISEPLEHISELSLFTAIYSARRNRPATDQGVRFTGPPELSDVVALIPMSYSSAISAAVLRPVLTAPDSQALLESLAAFIETTSVAQAAAALRIHRNTARYRRAELENKLGIDLSNGRDRSMCALALAPLNP